MTNNNEKLQTINEKEVEARYIEFLNKYPEVKEIGKKMLEEMENTYEFHEGDEENTEWFSFRVLGIKITAIKPSNPVYSDMLVNTFVGFIKFVESAKDYDMKVKGDNLIQKMPGNNFCVYAKADPSKKNSRYSEYIGNIDFDTFDADEFRNKLDDFKAMFCPAAGYEPTEEEMKGLIARHSA